MNVASTFQDDSKMMMANEKCKEGFAGDDEELLLPIKILNDKTT